METSIQPSSDDSGVSSGASQEVKAVGSSSASSSQDKVSVQDSVIPTAAAEPAPAQTNSTSDAAPVVAQDTLAASKSQNSDHAAEDSQAGQPEAMEVDAEASLENAVNDATEHSTVHENGTDESQESSLVNSDSHLTSSPGKLQAAIRKDYVPSSTAIDSRKFILNPTFPVELMDPAYCFSVVSYNVLADCHLCRLALSLLVLYLFCVYKCAKYSH